MDNLRVVLKKQSVEEGVNSTASEVDQWADGGSMNGVFSVDIYNLKYFSFKKVKVRLHKWRENEAILVTVELYTNRHTQLLRLEQCQTYYCVLKHELLGHTEK